MGNTFQKEDFCAIHLGEDYQDLDVEKVQTYERLNDYIQSVLKKNNAKVGKVKGTRN